MSARDLYDAWLNKLRYVKRGDWVLTIDHNAKAGCLNAARDWLLEICTRYNIDPRYVYELDPYLARIRYVKAGDTILSSDHNTIVDALRKLRDILEKIEGNVYNEGYQIGYTQGYQEGVTYCLENLAPLKAMLKIGADILENVNPADELNASIMMSADVDLETQVQVNTEVSITLST